MNILVNVQHGLKPVKLRSMIMHWQGLDHVLILMAYRMITFILEKADHRPD